MALSTQILIPVSTADKLADVGRAILELAHEIKLRSQIGPWVKPKKVPKDQEWFWTKEWQAGEREVDEALARGEYREFDNVEEAIKELHRHV